MRRSIHQITLQAGDRLEKVGMSGRVWVVEHLVRLTDQPPHAVIVYDTNQSETRMLAQSGLCDKSRYRRLPAASRRG